MKILYTSYKQPGWVWFRFHKWLWMRRPFAFGFVIRIGRREMNVFISSKEYRDNWRGEE